ncbi:hypothetical protein [Streptomyces sp. MS2.AVA.5]|uniref:Uncharacterized protein n=1 Tax=Streptomyces achmelvichensis TaxID=3134111 RepID=A0ACC6PME9_9ACTN
MIKTNQPTAHAQLAALPWPSIAVQHTASGTGHGRRESRSIKTCGIADELGGIAFPHARLAIRVHRRRKQTGERETRCCLPLKMSMGLSLPMSMCGDENALPESVRQGI